MSCYSLFVLFSPVNVLGGIYPLRRGKYASCTNILSLSNGDAEDAHLQNTFVFDPRLDGRRESPYLFMNQNSISRKY
jgi:hypothetical protein